MDGTGRLFAPLLQQLSPNITASVVRYPTDVPLGYTELLPIVTNAAIGDDFVVLGESFSGPLAMVLAAAKPAKLRGVILCASFVESPIPCQLRWSINLLRSWMIKWTPRWIIGAILLGRQRGERQRLLDETLAKVS